mmetsp:Transcript_1689/g.3160  ORF Transcript_1689/g.3160 Transcript_1689/m.3160 type:complete len:208 (+) Transcript_1689:348-971(+)|eukprot:CAMPEP_0114470206 /NCGR_PEP_ID=MMETSP0104-20121206/11134_1 /TAXON_ID=37642 ORGANISM="Paraphysomonas imperforata, Strain PA2" /NCGR_SAMPLE_ID=MMETSP0104 /ASSEMBLY_ACC=CAM_ASM_000202 /LENGTH=207 /DNA_ID=CAMNT_0001643927 /DNA_START=169 /DNA_END=792 /DNA_ORIENTATION=+
MSFRVNRDILAEASPVWHIMLRGDYMEGGADSIELHDDDPQALRVVFDILHNGLSLVDDDNNQHYYLPMAEMIREVSDKYDIKALKSQIQYVTEIEHLNKRLIAEKDDALTSIQCERRELDSALKNMQRFSTCVPICTSCCRRARLKHHCDRCATKYRVRPPIVMVQEKFVGKGKRICTNCGTPPRLPHHCDSCTHGNYGKIITLQE